MKKINLKTGISLKISRFLSTSHFVSVVVSASRFHEYVFIDYEGAECLLLPMDIEYLLQQMKRNLVLTIASRGIEFQQGSSLLQQYLALYRKYDNLQFCIVVGHPSYATVSRLIPLTRSLNHLFTQVKEIKDTELFFGVENIPLRMIRDITAKFSKVVPFVLNGDHRINKMASEFDDLALYTPFFFNVSVQAAVRLLKNYLLRRRYTRDLLAKTGLQVEKCLAEDWEQLFSEAKRVLLVSLEHYVLTPFNVQKRLTEFLEKKVSYIVGNPLLVEEISEFYRMFRS